MCNPRRVRITVTRKLSEAWKEQIEETVRLEDKVRVQKRLCHQMRGKLPEAVREALRKAMAEAPHWQDVDEGFRFDAGQESYAFYHRDRAALEIVAAREEEVMVEHTVRKTVSGVARGDVTLKRRVRPDSSTEQADVERAAGKKAVDQVAADKNRQVHKAHEKVWKETQKGAKSELEETRKEKEEELARDAEASLDELGKRCQRAFFGVMGKAYGQVIRDRARGEGVEERDIDYDETDDYIEVGYRMRV